MINAETLSRKDGEIIENLLSEQVLDAAIEVHRTLGGPRVIRKLIGDQFWTKPSCGWVVQGSQSLVVCLSRVSPTPRLSVKFNFKVVDPRNKVESQIKPFSKDVYVTFRGPFSVPG